jgi:hypothetical protein
MDERVMIDLAKSEVLDLLDVGRVGLYEFVDVLRSPGIDLDEVERVRIAEAALAELRAEQRVRLVWQNWADLDFSEDASAVVPTPEAWLPPEQDPFLAVVRNGDLDMQNRS